MGQWAEGIAACDAAHALASGCFKPDARGIFWRAHKLDTGGLERLFYSDNGTHLLPLRESLGGFCPPYGG